MITGVPELHVVVDRAAMARYGLDVTAVRELIGAATGGLQVREVIQNQRRFPIAIWLPSTYRADLSALGNLQLKAPGGELVRLNQVAELATVRGPESVSRENTQQRVVVQCNVRGTDLGSFVAAAQSRMKGQLKLLPGYSIDWGGQCENQQRARKRLMICSLRKRDLARSKQQRDSFRNGDAGQYSGWGSPPVVGKGLPSCALGPLHPVTSN